MTEEKNDDGGMRGGGVVVITCAVLEAEVNHYKQYATDLVHVEMMEQGLHNDPPRLRIKLQATVEQMEERFSPEAIVLGYGLCSRGIEGVKTRRAKLVVARAHDCITLLLGSRARYAEYVKQYPGTYWYSPGWNKYHLPPGKARYEKLHTKYVEQFGEEDAKFLMEEEQHWFTTYNRATYVDLTVGATESDLAYTRECADWLKWNFDHVRGDPALLKALLSGNWPEEDFLVLEPGWTVGMTADERIIEAVDGQGNRKK